MGDAPAPGGGAPGGGDGSFAGGRDAAGCPKARKRNMVRTAKLGRARSLGGASTEEARSIAGPPAGGRTASGAGGIGLTMRGGSNAGAAAPAGGREAPRPSPG